MTAGDMLNEIKAQLRAQGERYSDRVIYDLTGVPPATVRKIRAGSEARERTLVQLRDGDGTPARPGLRRMGFLLERLG